MRYSGIQPQYFPRLHYFARILNADVFVIRDDAQFVSKHKYPDGRVDKSYQAHTPIKQSFGVHLLAIPIKHEGLLPLYKTKIAYGDGWAESHLKTLRIVYGKADNFNILYPEIEAVLTSNYPYLADLNDATIFWGLLHLLGEKKVKPESLKATNVMKYLGKEKQFRLKKIQKASETPIQFEKLSANEKIVSLIKEVGANEDYCGGTGAAAYMDEDIFKKNGIKITVQDWKCAEYPQLFTKQVGFIPNLSIIDLLMNTDLKEARSIILGDDKKSF